MSKFTWLIDAGHGGMSAEGKYMTDPKWGKFYKHSENFTAYEGVTNRKIARLLMAELTQAEISCLQVHDNVLDINLSGLVARANKAHEAFKNCIYLSIHSNAGKGKGFEVFTSKGETKSDKFAEVFCNHLQKDFPEYPLRQDVRDGDKDKEEDFYVLKYTNCPAVLCELLFFDELKQAEFLNSQIGQERLAMSLFKAIKEIESL
jgi:N-acetylmuramoyl-L-alanine amidase